MGVTRRLVAIFYADVAGYSRLTGADEEGTHRRVMALLDDVTDKIKSSGGDVLRYAGDAILAVFPSVVLAVDTSASIQTTIAECNADVPKDERVQIRIGINVGDVIEDRGEVFGEGVNLAARLEAAAEPGGLCISDDAYRQCRKRSVLTFRDGGEQSFKNIDGPVHVYHWAPGAISDTTRSSDKPLPLPDKPSIAVLPFDNMSGDPEQEYFSDGITEDIISELSKISGLFVIARHSSFRFKGQPVSLKQVGKELGVRYILEGSVRRAGNRLRITTQLIDSQSDAHIWGERFDRNLEDVFELQDEVARRVSSSLSVVLSADDGTRLESSLTTNVETYDFYLRTRRTLWPPTRENILTARNAYKHIVDLDPAFAGGYAGYSMTFALAVYFGQSSDRETDIERALLFAKQAVEKDQTFALAQCSLAIAHAINCDYEIAADIAGEAIAMQPGDADVQTYSSLVYLTCGKTAEALGAIEKALRQDPGYVEGPHLNLLGIICFVSGDYERAIDAFDRNRERGGPIGVPALVFHTASLVLAHQSDRAKTCFQELWSFQPEFEVETFSVLNNLADLNVTERITYAFGKIS